MPRRILIADDDASVLKLCGRCLSMNNYEVTSCANLAEAARQINTGDFQILLTDFSLGDGYGTELIALIKNKNPSAKTLLMTGDEILAGTRGPGPYYADAETLIKPFDMNRLLAELDGFDKA